MMNTSFLFFYLAQSMLYAIICTGEEKWIPLQQILKLIEEEHGQRIIYHSETSRTF